MTNWEEYRNNSLSVDNFAELVEEYHRICGENCCKRFCPLRNCGMEKYCDADCKEQIVEWGNWPTPTLEDE